MVPGKTLIVVINTCMQKCLGQQLYLVIAELVIQTVNPEAGFLDQRRSPRDCGHILSERPTIPDLPTNHEGAPGERPSRSHDTCVDLGMGGAEAVALLYDGAKAGKHRTT